MKKFSKIAAFIFALSLSATVMTACGDSKDSKKSEPKSVEDIDEKDIEDALNKLDEETSKELAKEKEEATEATTAAEIVYEPTEEIKKASFRSGYIQIGDTVFRNGCYITVADFVDKYGDKFDMSEIALDEYLTPGELKVSSVPSLEDTRITLKVCYGKNHAEDNERVKIQDAIVSTVSIDGDGEGIVYYPTGVYTMDYDTAKSCITDMGLKEIKEVGFTTLDNDAYIEQKDYFYTDIDGDEDNLYGVKPKYFYIFSFDPSTLKGTKIYIDKLWS